MHAEAPTERDWEELTRLARQSGAGDERVMLLRDRLEQLENAGPVLVIGRFGGGIGAELDGWLGPQTAEVLLSSPRRTVLAASRHDACPEGPPLVTRPSGAPPVLVMDVESGFRSDIVDTVPGLGPPALCVLITSFSQALPQEERKVLRAVSRLVPSLRIVVCARAGEVRNTGEVSRVVEFVRQRAAALFVGPRLFGVAVLDEGGHGETASTPWAIEGLEAALSSTDAEASRASRSFVEQQVTEILVRAAEVDHQSPIPALDGPRQEEVLVGFGRALDVLRDELERAVVSFDDRTDADAALRARAIDEVLGWVGPPNSFASSHAAYAERLRPGLKRAVVGAARSHAMVLTLARPAGRRKPQAGPPERQRAAGSTGAVDRLLSVPNLLAGPLVVGVLAWGVFAFLGPGGGVGAAIGAVAASVAAGSVGFMIARRRTHPVPDSSSTTAADPALAAPVLPTHQPRVEQFNTFRQRVLDELELLVRTPAGSTRQRARELAEHLGLPAQTLAGRPKGANSHADQ